MYNLIWSREFKQALEGLKRKEEQDTQGDWVKVGKSSFCKFYGKIEKTVDREKSWDKKGINEEMKEEWARLSCSNIGKVGNKGYKDWSCRICGKEDESINHI